MSTIQFTALIRLPFARGDFVDPPQADWNATKDRALWKVISKSSKTSDLNWVELAERFQVPQTFLLQQAAWLYERHLEHVRSQMKKVGSVNAPPTSGSGSSNTIVGGLPMQRGGSHGSRASRTPSALSIRPKENLPPRVEPSTQAPAFASREPSGGIPSNPTDHAVLPPLSRTPSTNTITQSRAQTQTNQIRPSAQRSARPSITGQRPVISSAPPPASQSQILSAGSPETSALSSSSSSSDSDEAPVHRSQLFKRPPRFQKQRPRGLLSYDEDADEGEDPADSGDVSLPFAQPRTATGGGISGGRKGGPNAADTARSTYADKNRQGQPTRPESVDASSSLASSASDVPRPSKTGPGPLSPKHRAELAKLSPRTPGTKSKKDGSEGTPSMGSSFSDIDDAGISQSALEDALLSNIHAGRMSTLSQLRSRYL